MATRFFNPSWLMPTNGNQSKSSNYSMEFNGTSDYINCGNPTALQITGNLSISAWVKFDNATAASDWFVAKDDNGGGAGRSYMLNRLNTGKIRFAIQRSSLKSVQSSTVLSSDTWYHVVGVNDGTDLKVYINGSLDNTTAGDGGAIDNGNSDFTLGANEIPGGYLAGSLDQVAIFDYALSGDDITTLYGSGTPGNPMSLANLPVAYYPLGDNTVYNGTDYLVQNSSLQDYVFDFVPNDYIAITNNSVFNLGTAFTISGWFNFDALGYQGLISFDATSGGSPRGWFLFQISGTNDIKFFDGSNSWVVKSGYGTTGEWDNFILTYDGSDLVFYINGVQESTQTVVVDVQTNGNDGEIGNNQYAASRYFNGKMSNIVMWNSDQTSQKDNIYNNGSPATSYTNAPVAWWKLDASATYDGTNWTIPDDSTNSNTGTSSGMTTANLVTSDLSVTEAFEKYSLNFDGANDYINMGNVSALDFDYNDPFSISAWISFGGVSGAESLVSKQESSGDFRGYNFIIHRSGANYTLRLSLINDISPVQYIYVWGTTSMSQYTWYHVVVTYDGSNTAAGVKFYIDGSSETTTIDTDSLGTNTTLNSADFNIGERNSGSGGLYYHGNISNVAVFNSELSAANIVSLFNGGKPGDLSSFSPAPVSWWRLGENSYCPTGGQWTVLDEISTNTGTSFNMGEEDLQGYAPLTYGNGTSSGMGGDELKGEAANSTSNSISTDMNVIARVTETPA